MRQEEPTRLIIRLSLNHRLILDHRFFLHMTQCRFIMFSFFFPFSLFFLPYYLVLTNRMTDAHTRAVYRGYRPSRHVTDSIVV